MRVNIAILLFTTITSSAFAQERSKQIKVLETVLEAHTTIKLTERFPDHLVVDFIPSGPYIPALVQPTEPLYVIDGILSEEKDLIFINPEDIKSFDILKKGYNPAFSCGLWTDVIIVKTKNGLTKRELRKLKRQQRRDARKQANALK